MESDVSSSVEETESEVLTSGTGDYAASSDYGYSSTYDYRCNIDELEDSVSVKEKEESHWNHGWDQLKEEHQKWSSSESPELEREHLDSGLELSQEYESDIEGFELSPSPCTGD